MSESFLGTLKELVDLVSTKTLPESGNTELRCINLEDIPEVAGRIVSWSQAADNLSMKTQFQAGDVLFGKLRPYLRKFALANFNGVCTTEILAFRPKAGVDPNFVYQIVSSDAFIDHNVAVSYGTKMPRTDWKTAASFPVLIPSQGAQRGIAKVLSALDEQIEATVAIVAKFEATRTGLVRDLLAEIANSPKKPLKELAEIGSGITLGREFSGTGTAEYPYLRVANVQDGRLELSEVKTIRIPIANAEKVMLQPGDVLMNEGGDFDKLGRGAVWEGQIPNCLHQNHVFRVRCDPSKLLPGFLSLWAASDFGKRFFILASKQSTNLASINSSQLKGFPVLVPSVEKQREILDAVEAIDAIQTQNKAEVAKLRLQKQGLMHDLLTGAVRVTEVN